MVRTDRGSAARAYVSLDELMRLRDHARGFSLLPHQPRGGALAGRHGSRLRGRGLDFAELRRYQDGDDIRAIDWLATARLRAPQVRIYAEERDRVTLLIVDQRITMFFGSQRATKAVVAAEAAALAAWRVIKAGDRIAALVFDDKERIVVRPSRRVATVHRVLSEIVRLNNRLSSDAAPPDPAMLNRAIAEAAHLAPHDWLIVVISDNFGADATTAQLISGLCAHNDVIGVLIHDPLEAELPTLGRVVVAEGAARLAVETGSARLRRAYGSDFAARQAIAHSFGRHRAIPILTVRTDADVAAQIRSALHRTTAA
ncbi:MAG TPA: DUF58 domain-containing protein [Acetobacteraceae bacterium]|nr:DUF58 domain-containing protein [Acetobacteraceae bacterium]